MAQEKGIMIVSRLTELSETYKRVKRLILLVEYYNKEKGIVLASINELRNAFDHVMRSMYCDSMKQTEEEFACAHKHLIRAAYDACEVLLLDRMEYIENLKRLVTYEAIDKVCPNYTSEIFPFLFKVKTEIVGAREITDTNDRIERYEELITKAIEYSEQVEKAIPQAVEERKHREWSSMLSATFVSALFGVILLGVTAVGYLFPETSITVKMLTGVACGVCCVIIYLFKKRKEHTNV